MSNSHIAEKTHGCPLMADEEIEKGLGALAAPGQVFEIRILEPKRPHGKWAPKVISGYFDSPSEVAPALIALRLAGWKGVYITLNPVSPELIARSRNRFSDSSTPQTTGDKDIEARRWLLIDCDPKRTAGISASDGEKEHAFRMANQVHSYLGDAEWPEPITADSGNGYHLLYRIDLPSESESVKRCLEGLSERFSNDVVEIDTTVANPARICKLYGTRSEKGDHCPDIGRPHRMSRILRLPDSVEVVTEELLLSVSGKKEPDSLPKEKPSRRGAWDAGRVQDFIDQHLSHCKPEEAQPYDGGFKWVLGICPFNSEHSDRSAVIVTKADGVIGFTCHHNGCAGHGWKELRALFEPTLAPNDGDLESRDGAVIHRNADGAPSAINQLAIASKYVRENQILYDSELELIYTYTPETGLWETRYERQLKVHVGRFLGDLLKAHGAESLLKRRTQNAVSQIVEFIKGEASRAGAFRPLRSRIHVGNGVLHLDDKPPTLREFCPDYYSRNRSAVCFDEKAECPRFLAELLEHALCPDDIFLIQRYAGQCLLGSNLSQTMLLMRGTAGGGKSTLVNIIEKIVGTHNVSQLRVNHLDDKFELAGFVGKTLLCGKDVPKSFLNHRSAYVLKALVGGDRLNAEQKNVKQRFEVQGAFNVLITSNSRLHVGLDADTAAWRRRLLIVDYERPPTDKRIPNFDDTLIETEGAGILNWLIAGAIELLNDLDRHGRIQLTTEQTRRVDALLCESDSVRQFVQEIVEPGDPLDDVTTAELIAAYSDYCDDKGWEPVRHNQFERQIADAMMEFHRIPKRTDVKRDGKNQRGFMKARFLRK